MKKIESQHGMWVKSNEMKVEMGIIRNSCGSSGKNRSWDDRQLIIPTLGAQNSNTNTIIPLYNSPTTFYYTNINIRSSKQQHNTIIPLYNSPTTCITIQTNKHQQTIQTNRSSQLKAMDRYGFLQSK